MKADNIFNGYYDGKVNELFTVLKGQAGNYAESGDIVQLSRVLSYYGAVNLICNNDFIVSTLFKQINEEYVHTCDDPRIKASYARFLAMYSSLSGKFEDASSYYMDARLSYPQTDWYPDEAITLLESVCYHYLFIDDTTEFYNILERLKILNNHLEGHLDGDLILLHSISKDNNYIEINNNAGILEKAKSSGMPTKLLISFILMKDALLKPDKSIHSCKTKPLSQFLGIQLASQQNCPIIQLLEEMSKLVDMADQKDFNRIGSVMNAAKAKAERFKHPWYKDRLMELQECLVNIGSDQNNRPYDFNLPEIRHPAGRISVSLLGKCHLNCKNTVFDINSFGTRTGNELLLYLLTRNNLQVHKEVLVELFFPGEEPEKAYNRLYVNIHRLNKVLQTHFNLHGDSDFVFIKQSIVCINSNTLEEFDVQKYRKIMSVANQLWVNDKEAATGLMNQAADMYSADIAPGFYYFDWLDEFRHELKSIQLKALTRVLQYNRDGNNRQACSEAFYNLIELDSLNEDYYIEYIDYIIKDGRDVEAVNLYNQYKTRLKKELGLTPSLKLKNLMSRIMR